MVKRQKKNWDEDSSIDPSARENIYDEVDEYNEMGKENDDFSDLNDSENEFEGATRVISKDRRKEQVLGLDLDSPDEEDDMDDEEDENSDMDFNSDIESSSEKEQQQQDMKEYRSLGTRKKDRYGTDITDERIFNIMRQRTKKKGAEDDLLIEMGDTTSVQTRILPIKPGFADILGQELSDEEIVDSMEDRLKSGHEEIRSKVKKSKKKKMQGKFSEIDKLAKEVIEELQSKLIPLIQAHKKGILPESFDTNYLLSRYFLCLNFMTTFSAEKMLIASETDMEGHSVEKRLPQYRELFNIMETCKEKYESEIDSVLGDLKSGKLKKKQRKLLGVVKGNKKKTIEEELPQESEEMEERDFDNEEMYSADEDNSEVEENNKESVNELENTSDGKRLITSEISRNKGLMPSRKKEQRNPRVKYKKKYLNKLKRRKGQVREVRFENKRYSGEISGINRNVIKSIKLQ